MGLHPKPCWGAQDAPPDVQVDPQQLTSMALTPYDSPLIPDWGA